MKRFLLPVLLFSLFLVSGTAIVPAANVHHQIESKKDVTVYITNTGHRYHRAGCRYLRRSCIKTTMSKAKKMGLTPCKVCQPPE